MAQNRTCNLSVTGRPSSPLRHVFKVPPDHTVCTCKYGYDPVLLGGRLQMCMQWYLNYGAVPNSEVTSPSSSPYTRGALATSQQNGVRQRLLMEKNLQQYSLYSLASNATNVISGQPTFCTLAGQSAQHHVHTATPLMLVPTITTALPKAVPETTA
jgi:hypothetical protein